MCHGSGLLAKGGCREFPFSKKSVPNQLYSHIFVGQQWYYRDVLDGWRVLDDIRFVGQKYIATDTLTIHTPLSDILDSADKLEKGYRFPVPLVLTKEQAQ
jgi:hypothetical protein